MKNILLFSMVLFAITTQAQDRLFTFTHQSNVLNKGQREIEVWNTMASGMNQFYRGFDHSIEFEMGLGSNLQTSFYLDHGYSKGIESTAGIDAVVEESHFSFKNEWKLKLSDPVADAMGSALYFETKLATEETELEGKFIFDKKIGNTLHALNIVSEYAFLDELENNGTKIDVKKGSELNFNLNYGCSYRLNDNLSLGLELMNNNRNNGDKWIYSTIYAGPTLSYNAEGFWINVSFVPQITDLRSGALDLNYNQKYLTRLLFSYAL